VGFLLQGSQRCHVPCNSIDEISDSVTIRRVLRASLDGIKYLLFDIFLSFIVEFGVVDVLVTIAAWHWGLGQEVTKQLTDRGLTRTGVRPNLNDFASTPWSSQTWAGNSTLHSLH